MKRSCNFDDKGVFNKSIHHYFMQDIYNVVFTKVRFGVGSSNTTSSPAGRFVTGTSLPFTMYFTLETDGEITFPMLPLSQVKGFRDRETILKGK